MNDDLISRQAVIAFLQSIPYIKEHPNMGELMKEWIEQIPSVQPKTGRWIETDDYDYDVWRCSKCEEYFYFDEGTPQDNKYDYCPCCGAKMESEE